MSYVVVLGYWKMNGKKRRVYTLKSGEKWSLMVKKWEKYDYPIRGFEKIEVLTFDYRNGQRINESIRHISALVDDDIFKRAGL